MVCIYLWRCVKLSYEDHDFHLPETSLMRSQYPWGSARPLFCNTHRRHFLGFVLGTWSLLHLVFLTDYSVLLGILRPRRPQIMIKKKYNRCFYQSSSLYSSHLCGRGVSVKQAFLNLLCHFKTRAKFGN